MNAAHLHLMFTHLPIVGIGFAVLLNLYAIISKSNDIKCRDENCDLTENINFQCWNCCNMFCVFCTIAVTKNELSCFDCYLGYNEIIQKYDMNEFSDVDEYIGLYKELKKKHNTVRLDASNLIKNQITDYEIMIEQFDVFKEQIINLKNIELLEKVIYRAKCFFDTEDIVAEFEGELKKLKVLTQ